MPYHHLRKGRYSRPFFVYTVTTVTDNRYPFFEKFDVARLLVGQLRQLHTEGMVASLAWVVMPDHLHWLIQLGEQAELGGVMKRLKARSAQQINQHLERKGSIWQKAYFDRAVRQEEDIRQIARYIVANPLRAGLAEDIGAYPHWDCIWIRDEVKGVL